MDRLAAEEQEVYAIQEVKTLTLRFYTLHKLNLGAFIRRNDDDDGYEDEGFEDYDEDFEADEEDEAPPKRPLHVEPAAPTRQAKTVSSYNSNQTQQSAPVSRYFIVLYLFRV